MLKLGHKFLIKPLLCRVMRAVVSYLAQEQKKEEERIRLKIDFSLNPYTFSLRSLFLPNLTLCRDGYVPGPGRKWVVNRVIVPFREGVNQWN